MHHGATAVLPTLPGSGPQDALECAEHERTGRWVGRLARAVAVLVVLLIISVLVGWRLLA